MARLKRLSKVVETARVRLAAMRSIDSQLDLGNGVTVAEFGSRIDAAEDSLEAYNTALSLLDERKLNFEKLEDSVKDYHERILLGVGSKFGRDSVEYEKAGGTRKSGKRRPKPAANPTGGNS